MFTRRRRVTESARACSCFFTGASVRQQLWHLGSALSAAPVPWNSASCVFQSGSDTLVVFSRVCTMVTVTPPAPSVLFQVQAYGPIHVRRGDNEVLHGGEEGLPGRATGMLCVRVSVTESARDAVLPQQLCIACCPISISPVGFCGPCQCLSSRLKLCSFRTLQSFPALAFPLHLLKVPP